MSFVCENGSRLTLGRSWLLCSVDYSYVIGQTREQQTEESQHSITVQNSRLLAPETVRKKHVLLNRLAILWWSGLAAETAASTDSASDNVVSFIVVD